MRTQTALLILLLAPTIASAQTEFRPGVRVRLEAPGIVAGKLEGTVLSSSMDSVVIGSESVAPLTIPTSRITSIEIWRGKSHSAGAVRGVPWGVGSGLVFGLATMGDLHNYCSNSSGVTYRCNQPTTSGEKTAWAAASTVAGALYGLLIGALIPVEQWERFPVTSRTTVTMRPGKASVGMSLAF